MTATPLRTYDDVIAAFRARMDECGLSMTIVDENSGLPSGYVGKVLGPSRVKMMGFLSFFEIAEALALKVTIEPDLEAAQRMAAKWERRDELRRRPGVVRRPISPEMLKKVASELGRIRGSAAKQFRIPLEKRREINRRNAKRGWRKRRMRVLYDAAVAADNEARAR